MSLKKTNKTHGFTLIELLVVIAIIGILSSVVLASLTVARQKSRDARRVSDLEQMRTALELYFDANSSYPTSSAATLQKWDSLGSYNQGGGIQSIATTTGATIRRVPTPPLLTYNYYYCPQTSAGASAGCDGTSNATYYSLGADLERTDNTSLRVDADRKIMNGGATTFDGLQTVCDNSTLGTDRCFDVTP